MACGGCKITVICEQQQALAVEIESADVVNTPSGEFFALYQIGYQRAVRGIFEAADVTRRFVQEDIEVTAHRLNQLTVYFDMVFFGFNTCAKVGDLAVNSYSPGANEGVGCAPGSNPG